MAEVLHLPRRDTTRLLTKKELARELGKSTRWIEIKMRDEGLPVEPRASRHEDARFDSGKVRAWMDLRAAAKPLSLEERVRVLERTVASLIERKAS